MFQITMPFPDDGLVYDYCLDDGGISVFDPEAENDEASRSRRVSTPSFKISYFFPFLF